MMFREYRLRRLEDALTKERIRYELYLEYGISGWGRLEELIKVRQKIAKLEHKIEALRIKRKYKPGPLSKEAAEYLFKALERN